MTRCNLHLRVMRGHIYDPPDGDTRKISQGWTGHSANPERMYRSETETFGYRELQQFHDGGVVQAEHAFREAWGLPTFGKGSGNLHHEGTATWICWLDETAGGILGEPRAS